MQLIWKTEKPPESLGKTHLTSIWKRKGSRKQPKNSRAIQIGSTTTKILTIILINRLKDWYEKQLIDFQNGFRTGRGTSDGIYITKTTQYMVRKLIKRFLFCSSI